MAATITIILCLILISFISSITKSKRIKRDIKVAQNKIHTAAQSSRITEEQREFLSKQVKVRLDLRKNIDAAIDDLEMQRLRHNELVFKYGEEIGTRLINHDYWVGMTEEHLIDCKGQPHKIEKEVLKTKTKVTFVYGNRSSGDYFVLENGQVVKFVDR